MKRLLPVCLLFTLLACTGGGSKPTPPPPTPVGPNIPVLTTGIKGAFRALKTAPAAQVVQGASASVVTQTMSPRNNHRAIQMMNGKVLIVGGDTITAFPSPATIPSMDIFDPATESFTKSAAVPKTVRQHRMGTGSLYNDFGIVNLPDGKVAIVGCATGGVDGTWTECHYFDIYDPVTDSLDRRVVTDDTGASGATIHLDSIAEAYYIGNNTLLLFSAFGGVQTLHLPSGKLLSTNNATPLLEQASTIQDASGNLWLVGGQDSANTRQYSAGVYRYDVAAAAWSRRKDMAVPRAGTTLVLLSDNKLGIYGGKLASGNSTSAVEIYDIAADTISTVTDLVGGRFNTTGVFLQTGFTLLAGGESSTEGVVSSEIVHRFDATYNFSGSTGSMVHPRSTHTVTALNNGLVLIAGGGDSAANVTAEVYDPQSKLLVQFTTETMLASTTQVFSTAYAAGVNWSVNKPGIASVASDGTVTSHTPGECEITATAKDDSTLTAVVRFRVIPQ